MLTTHQALIQDLTARGVMRSASVIGAFSDIDRALFVGLENREIAYADRPLPIGHAQKISQPPTVGFMLELLGAQLGDRARDVGSGSGWTTALLAHIVGPQGSVLGIERIPDLARRSREHLAAIGAKATVRDATPGVLGAPDDAPFDRILVSAAADDVPDGLVRQLRIGGVMVLPVRESVVHVERTGDDEVTTQEYPGFAFVPLLP